MTVFWILVSAALVLGGGGWLYSRALARWVGEDPGRVTPAVALADGRDFVATPTPVVFAHHFASIAGAGPIVGPVLAIMYGWAPALLWVLLGGLFFGAVHDYLATFLATREGGRSVATILRNMIGRRAFIAFVLFLILMLALVTATFLNLSATALVSMVSLPRLGLQGPEELGGLFRVVQETEKGQVVPKVVIGGIASMSVIVITACGPLVGWLYIKKKVKTWKCSLLALGICAAAIVAGLYYPVQLPPLAWQLALAAYVLLAAGVPVWLFLQSRDFINVHILYAGLVALAVILAAAAVTGSKAPWAGETFTIPAKAAAGGAGALTVGRDLQPLELQAGRAVTQVPVWPMLFITIACGAISGFHSLCAGGTTCKQLKSERAARSVGFNAMLLESFLAVCVIAVCVVGLNVESYVKDVYPKTFDAAGETSNPMLAFSMAVGWTAHVALGVPIVIGTLAGMILLEGFIVTTLDTAVRLKRYLFEEVWRALFLQYDVFASPVGGGEASAEYGRGEQAPVGAEGIPIAPTPEGAEPAPARPKVARGLLRAVLCLMRHYWFNSGLAVGAMLLFAMTGAAGALWSIFGTANQLLAAFVLLLASLWLLRRGRRRWFALAPALVMLVTTATSLVLLFQKFAANWRKNVTLLADDVVILVLTAYLLFEGVAAVAKTYRRPRAPGGA